MPRAALLTTTLLLIGLSLGACFADPDYVRARADERMYAQIRDKESKRTRELIGDAARYYTNGDFSRMLALVAPRAGDRCSYPCGYGVPQYFLGRMYDAGEGVAQDYAEARRWYLSATQLGDGTYDDFRFYDAWFNLGTLYYFGRGGPVDYAQAAKMYAYAADHGVPDAQVNLGAMYGNGQGVKEDFVQSLKWFTIAAKSFPDSEKAKRDTAASNRDRIAAVMTPAEIAEANKLAEVFLRR